MLPILLWVCFPGCCIPPLSGPGTEHGSQRHLLDSAARFSFSYREDVWL